MEEKSVRKFCRSAAVCDFVFIPLFTAVQSFAVGVWFGLEIYLFFPMGLWAVAGGLLGLLAVILSAGFIAFVVYGAVVLWRKEEEKKKIYYCCLTVSIVLAAGILISGIVLNIQGLRNIWLNLPVFFGCTALMTLNAVGFELKRRNGEHLKKECFERERRADTGMKSTDKEIGIGIEVIKGEYAGAVFPIQESEILTFGTQPEYCQVLFSNPFISRRHCSVCYKAELCGYEIIDYSKNGTYWMDGERLPFGEGCICPPGTVFTMGHKEQVLRLT